MKKTDAFIFFGTPEPAVHVLDELAKNGLLPALVVTAPDRRQGRGLTQAPAPAKVWAVEHDIPVLSPEKLDAQTLKTIRLTRPALAVIAAYGKLLPSSLLEAFPRGAWNIHPSLLPRYRGATPVESAILNDEKETGVSVMQIDEQMDHGPLAATEKVALLGIEYARELRERLFRAGGALLARIFPEILDGSVRITPQNEARASYTKKFSNESGKIDLAGNAEENYRIVRALAERGDVYFTANKKSPVRVSVKAAELRNGKLIITRATPAGKKEMNERELVHWLSS